MSSLGEMDPINDRSSVALVALDEVLAWVTPVVKLVHSKVVIGVFPSMSAVVAAQFKMSFSVGLVGVNVMSTMVGTVLSTMIVAVPTFVSSIASVAVIVQLTVSPTETSVLSRLIVEPLPILFPPTSHSIKTVGVSPSGSVAEPRHSREELVKAWVGVMDIEPTVGGRFAADMETLNSACSPNASTTDAVQVTCSPGMTVKVDKSRELPEKVNEPTVHRKSGVRV